MFEEDELDRTKIHSSQVKSLASLDFKMTPINYITYMKFFLIHFVNYNILGPFTAIFFVFSQRQRNLCHNMQLFRPTMLCFLNMIPWLCNFLTIFYFWRTGFKDSVYSVIIYNTVTISTLKCAIIAGKYCSLGYEKLEQYHIRKIPLKELHAEHMLESWADQTPMQVYKHLTTAMSLHEFDDSNFYVSFFKTPKKETLELLYEAEKEEIEINDVLKARVEEDPKLYKKAVKNLVYDEKKKLFTLSSAKRNQIKFLKKGNKLGTTIHYFRGKTVLYALIKKANQNQLNKYASWISVFVGILRGYMPTVVYLEKWSFIPGSSLQEKVILGILNFTLIHFYYYVTRFILQIVIDYRRKTRILKELQSMLKPHKIYKTKIMPTINILDATNGHSWMKMRKAAKNYGYSITKRHELLIPTLFVYMIGVYLCSWLVGLRVYKLEKSFIHNLYPFLKMDYVIFSILILILLLILARVNSFAVNHIVTL
jgi:hypothetical protein